MPRFELHRLLTTSLLIALTLTGCSKGSTELARVGDRAITLDEFTRVGAGNEANYGPDAEAAKNALLDDLVKRQLMLEYARRSGLDSNAIARGARASIEERALTEALLKQLATARPPVSETEARRFHDWRGIEANVQLIYTPDELAARQALSEIRAGRTFEETAQRFNPPGMLPPDGSLGWQTPGGLVQPLDDLLRTLPLKQIRGPYGSPQGWFLVRVNERRGKEPVPFELQAAGLTDALRQRKQRARLSSAVDELKHAYALETVPGSAQVLYQLFVNSRVGGLPQPVVTPETEATVLTRWNGGGPWKGAFTIGDALADLRRPDTARPPADNLVGLRSWAESQTLSRILLQEARRRSLHLEPEVRGAITRQFENTALEAVYTSVVSSVPRASIEEVRALFEQNRAQFSELVTARVAYALVADSAVAKRLAGGRVTGGALRDFAATVDPALTIQEEVLRYPNDDLVWGGLRLPLASMRPGQWDGPVETPRGYLVMQLLDAEFSQQPLESLPAAMQENLFNSATEMARERAFNAFLDSLRTQYAPKLNPEKLKSVRWPLSAAPAGAGS